MTEKCITVLLIEDNPGDARLIREVLEEETSAQFKLEHADRLGAGLERLAEGGIDVALLDLSLPDSQGLDTFLQAHAHFPHLPIVVLTGLNDDTLAAETLKAGGQDYLCKRVLNYCILHRSIQHAMERKRTEKESRRAQDLDGSDDGVPDPFLAVLGDELRASLTLSLSTVSSLMDDPTTAAELLPALAMIRHHMERETRLIDDLQAYSRTGTRRESA